MRLIIRFNASQPKVSIDDTFCHLDGIGTTLLPSEAHQHIHATFACAHVSSVMGNLILLWSDP